MQGKKIREDLHPNCTAHIVKHPVSVMILGYLTSKDVGRIYVINGI